MRDDFSAPVKTTLAKRSAYRCNNPGCGANTSGPGSAPDKVINLGVAAHITAASPGGPRYDAALTMTQRRSAANGIWLCQTCAKLVDADVSGFSVELLGRWKTQAEAHAAQTLGLSLGTIQEPLDLVVPSVADDFLLSFANTSIEAIGREAELGELTAFLDDDREFAWWLWTGPAGVGKSRLAIELCRAVSGTWHAGLLREFDQERLGGLQVTAPTLVVVDYAAQRATWLTDALFALTQHPCGAKVRLLVLDREATGPWWETVQRHHRLEEAAHVAAARYGLPRELAGLSREQLRILVPTAAAHLKATLSRTNIEDIIDHALSIDPVGTPLFGLIATLDWLSDTTGGGRDDALRRLAARADAQLTARIGELGAAFRAKNVRLLSTALGGISIERYAELLEGAPSQPAGILPGLYGDVHDVPLGELLEGLRPDIVGELAVLERLASGGVDRHASKALLDLAWSTFGEGYAAFVERAADDHADHPHLLDLLDRDPELRTADWARLLVDVIPLLRCSDHPAVRWIVDSVSELNAIRALGSYDEILATARFRIATLVFHEGDIKRANELYSEILTTSEPSWRTHASALNNRGITWATLGRTDLAITDFTSVIESSVATEEMRASALNNRADMLDQHDPVASVADRTAVLALTQTTYNRRFIALSRRAGTRRRTGDHADAYDDIEAILASEDIAVEQKMSARLLRAEWRTADDRPVDALDDLEIVLASNRNFETVESRARALLRESRKPPSDH